MRQNQLRAILVFPPQQDTTTTLPPQHDNLCPILHHGDAESRKYLEQKSSYN